MKRNHPSFEPLVVTVGLVLVLAGCGPKSTEAPPAGEQPAAPVATDASALLPLPQFTSCGSTDHPLLPAKWVATALLQDFFHDTLTFGNFVYDESAGAFRFTLTDRYGLDADFLATTGGRLYVLSGGEQPSFCALATDQTPFTVPSRDWLDSGAVCVGQAPILERDQQWWKTPSGVGANWIWYDVQNQRLPFRTMYYAEADPKDPVPIYEYFTFNYFPTFKEVASTNLGEILAMCQGAQQDRSGTAWDTHALRRLLASHAYPETDADTIATVQNWIPGLSECSSTGSLPPPWPDQVQGSVFMTAVSFDPNPFPTRVFYDWTRRAQNTTLYYYPP
ncbi:MAG: hypothetical protein KDD11_23330, partial [Acidobacteria bacterium]|nr:hypothetical protein [Acidobacteriota bacterium]